MSDENTNQFEEESQDQELQTEAVESPAVYVNGNGSSTYAKELAAAPPGATAELKIKGTPAQFLGRGANALMGAVNRTNVLTRETKRVTSDREFLDELHLKPEFVRCKILIIRYAPTHDSAGNEVVCDRMMTVSVKPYDEVVEDVAAGVGGGRYKGIITDEHGREIPSVGRVILIDIPTSQYPPKNEVAYDRAGKVTLAPLPETGDSDDFKEDQKRHNEEMKRLALRQRQEDAEMKRMEAELKMKSRRLEIARMERQISGGNEESEMKALLLKLEADRLKAEQDRKDELRRVDDLRKDEIRRLDEERKEDRRQQDLRFTALMDQQREDRKLMMEALKPLPPPPQDNRLMEVMMAMFKSSSDQVVALASKPAPQLPAPPDYMPMLAEINKTNSQMFAALAQRPQEDKGEKMLDAMVKITNMTKKDDTLLNQLLTSALTKKDDGFGVKDFFTLMELGEQRTEKIFNKAQELAGAMAPAASEEITEDGYDPKLGFLGNAGKSLFAGLKSVVEMAATNPQVQELLVKMVGSRNPSQQDLAVAAMRMEHQFAPPPLMAPPPQQIQPQFRTPYAQPLPPSPTSPQQQQANELHRQQVNQQYAVPQPGQPQPQPWNRVDVVAPLQGPPPMSGQRPPAPQQTQQQAVANELEGAASGVTLPSNGDPEADVLPSNEEIARQAQVETVTATMAIALEEIITKPAVRTWAEHAHDTWPKALKEQIVAAPSMQEKVGLIMNNCAEDVWVRLNQKIEEEDKTVERGKEQMHFAGQLMRLVEMNTVKQGVAA